MGVEVGRTELWINVSRLWTKKNVSVLDNGRKRVPRGGWGWLRQSSDLSCFLLHVINDKDAFILRAEANLTICFCDTRVHVQVYSVYSVRNSTWCIKHLRVQQVSGWKSWQKLKKVGQLITALKDVVVFRRLVNGKQIYRIISYREVKMMFCLFFI